MAGDTTITVIGNLTKAPELKFTPQGHAVATFTVASTPRFMDRQTQEWKDGEPLFVYCQIWRQPAENAAESLEKGARVVVVGQLKQRSYQTEGGEKRTVYYLLVDEVAPSLRYATTKVQKMSRSNGNGQGGQQNNSGPSGDYDDPWASARPASTRSGGGSSYDDEPPF